ncbi:hypothetical protein SAMN04489761_4246 [Tenacibaculum sp. MAR_2009_124]|uniref:hypothetical protein n=1 Tax=Tenacibaculum sp. MAR_2009_124 TaxID=1250059 RepID=UPI000896DD80|nr:hypothetical protein [Tenacibaculum sp. MAR_2009_124]SED09186.1 hypothetical protein SAMN04489761_4246 [Tenacibaculum sp. MAR_2009_124]
MKTLTITTLFLLLSSNSILLKEQNTSVQIKIDPEKDCPENDRNCNGIPDLNEKYQKTCSFYGYPQRKSVNNFYFLGFEF